jgi:hypothetical protein
MKQTIEVSLTTDEDGFFTQECDVCHWRFKVKAKQVQTAPHKYCPYCAIEAKDFFTTEQRQYFKDVVKAQQVLALLRKHSSDFGFSEGFVSVEGSYRVQPTAIPPKEIDYIIVNKKFLQCCGKIIKLDEMYVGTIYCPWCRRQHKADSKVTEKQMQKYRKFQSSYRKLKDYAENVENSSYTNFKNSIRIFLYHLGKDEFFSVISENLLNIPSDAVSWYKEAENSMGGTVGSGNLILPDDEDERLALLYDLLRKIESDEILIDQLGDVFSTSSQYDDVVQDFNNLFFLPMIKLLWHKIDEIDDSLREESDVLEDEASFKRVVNAVINVQGDNTGNIIIGNDNIVCQVTSQAELEGELNKLLSIEEVEKNTEAQEFINELIQLSRKNEDRYTTVSILNKLVSLIPTCKEKLKSIAEKAVVGISTNVVIEGIKYLFG